MGRAIKIPIRVVRPTDNSSKPDRIKDNDLQEHQMAQQKPPVEGKPREDTSPAAGKHPVMEALQNARPRPAPNLSAADNRALRLQAEMDTYRLRQQRLAQERIKEERQRLLRAFLGVVDDLERALQATAGDSASLRQGVELTHRAALQLLGKEGVEQIKTQDSPFDPHWHEAVATVGHRGANTEPDTVVQVMEAGYRQGERLLRPAKVVVAV